MAEIAAVEIKPAAPDLSHCWDAILDSGGTVPICIPMDSDSKAVPYRMISVTREEQMFVHFKCCMCSKVATRRWKIMRDHDNHGSHHHAFTYEEVEHLPEGPCSAAQG